MNKWINKCGAVIKHAVAFDVCKCEMTIKTSWELLSETAAHCVSDNIQNLGAALAFYGMLSLVPLLVLLATAASIFFGTHVAQEQIYSLVEKVAGRDQANTISDLFTALPRATQSKQVVALVNIAILFYGASSVFNQLQDTLNLIWKTSVKAPFTLMRYLEERIFSLIIVLISSLLLIISVLINAAFSSMVKFTVGQFPDILIWARVGNLMFSFVSMFLLFSFIFKYIPREIIRWSDVWLGSCLTAILFMIGHLLISLYLSTSGVIRGYGALGSFVALMLWAYYSSQILFIGAEFTYIYARRVGSHKLDQNLNVNMQEENPIQSDAQQ